MFNYKRDNYQRPDKPCLSCPFYKPNNSHKCSEFTNIHDCSLYASWSKRNDAKKNIAQPSSIDNLGNESYDKSILTFLDSVENKEIIKKIDENISIKNRPIFLKFMGGSKLPKNQIKKLTLEIKEILQNNYE